MKKRIDATVYFGSGGRVETTIFVDENATDEEINDAIMTDVLDIEIEWHEVETII